MKRNPMKELFAFLERLDEAKITYILEHSRDDAMMVIVPVPGEYWEFEFLADGGLVIERYISSGPIGDRSALSDFYAKHVDPEMATSELAETNGAIANR